MTRDISDLITTLKLTKHPEGGYYREVYRSQELVLKTHLPARYSGNRAFSTSIYFLLPSEEYSAFHRIKSDEIWYYHAGSSVTIHMLDAAGHYSATQLGPGGTGTAGEAFQQVVPHGVWFAANVNEPNSYALMSCNVAPGFDFADFELGNREDLMERFPNTPDLVQRFTR